MVYRAPLRSGYTESRPNTSRWNPSPRRSPPHLRNKTDMPEKTASLRGLDAFNFFNAGIQTGLGPFIAIYYATDRHWNSGGIGVLLSIQSLMGVVCRVFHRTHL